MMQETLQLCLELLTDEFNQAEATTRFLDHQLGQREEFRIDQRPEEELQTNLLEQRKWRNKLEMAMEDIQNQLNKE